MVFNVLLAVYVGVVSKTGLARNCSSPLLIRFLLKNLMLVIKIKMNYFGYHQATVVTYKYGNFFHCNTKIVCLRTSNGKMTQTLVSVGEKDKTIFLWFKVRFIRTYFHGGSKEDNL